ncbi:conjugal transfer protein TrbG [Rickettsiales bacterium Ac37b]|nr:conjugal transfer protein TrbG [Rickettsiales bacterium Ac37b]
MKLPNVIVLPFLCFLLTTSLSFAETTKKVVPDIEPSNISNISNINGNSEIIATKAWQRSGVAKPIKTNNGIIKYPYGESSPTITCSPLHICDIELEAGEKILNVAIGDQVHWILSPANSGAGSDITPHVIIKPTDENISTNMVVTTDKRTYYLYLRSQKTGYITRLSFYYPHDLVQSWELHNKLKEEDEQNRIAEFPALTVAELDFNYEIKGSNKSHIRPIRVFNDGKHVYLQMSPKLGANEAPILMVIGKNGESQLVNYRMKSGYYVVDRLFDRAQLILGTGKGKEVVTIQVKKSCFFNCN